MEPAPVLPATDARQSGSSPSDPKTTLVRGLGLLDSVLLLVSGIIGSSIFLTAKDIASPLPQPVLFLLVWVLGALISLCACFAFAELGSMFPDSGGQYIYLREAFGDLTAFLYGWMLFSVANGGTIAALSVASAASALSGPLHGGANEEVLRMLDEIGSVKNIPACIKRVKAGEIKLMGFGHRVYKNYDPRARIIKAVANEVFEVTGRNTRLDIALELERIALEDDYFVTRKLYPNVDFYSGIIYQSMGFQPEMFTVLFAIPRAAGWLAQWNEMIQDPEQKIARPRQIYTGIGRRPFPTVQDEKNVAVKVG